MSAHSKYIPYIMKYSLLIIIIDIYIYIYIIVKLKVLTGATNQCLLSYHSPPRKHESVICQDGYLCQLLEHFLTLFLVEGNVYTYT